MFIIICKDSNTLQVSNTTMTKVVGKFTSRKGRNNMTVNYQSKLLHISNIWAELVMETSTE